MKYVVQLLNYDSEWVTYCESPTRFYAEDALEDLRRHGFHHYQIRILQL
jgi:hypothetical protein